MERFVSTWHPWEYANSKNWLDVQTCCVNGIPALTKRSSLISHKCWRMLFTWDLESTLLEDLLLRWDQQNTAAELMHPKMFFFFSLSFYIMWYLGQISFIFTMVCIFYPYRTLAWIITLTRLFLLKPNLSLMGRWKQWPSTPPFIMKYEHLGLLYHIILHCKYSLFFFL